MINLVRGMLRRRSRRQRLLENVRPVRFERMAAPQVRSLEPRIVLDASAELNVVGQLVVTGTPAAESVQLQVDVNGDLLLRDETGSVIAIDNNPNGPTNPLDPSAVTSGQIIFDMGGGDDLLDLQLPSGLDVNVLSGEGQDETNLQFSTEGLPKSNRIDVDSERITLDHTASPLVTLADDDVHLTGTVFAGLDNARSQLDIGAGNLTVDGHLVLTGDVAVVGSGRVDLSNAVASAATSQTSLRIDLRPGLDGRVLLGGADAAGGHFIEDLAISSARSVTIGASPVVLDGDLVIREVAGETHVDSATEADAVSIVTAGDIIVEDDVRTRGGEILLSTPGLLKVTGNLDTAMQNRAASVNLSGGSVQLFESQVTTAGGLVNVDGPVSIGGDVSIDTGNLQMADSAGRVQFFDDIQGDDASGDTLLIDARGSTLDGSVRLQGSVGPSSALPNAVPLNGLTVRAGQIEVDTVGVLGGDIRLAANTVRLFGHEIVTESYGQIVVDGDVLLPLGDTRFSSAESVRFTSLITGQPGTRDLAVAAGANAIFEGSWVIFTNCFSKTPKLHPGHWASR